MRTTRTLVRRRRRTRRVASTALAVLLGGALLLPGVAAGEDAVRTDPGDLGGYTSRALAAPFSTLIFEPFIPLPVDPGDPHIEVTFAMSRTVLSSGPTGRGLSTSIWPGMGLGDGFGQLADGQEWFFKADARYPDGPEEDSAPSPTGGEMWAAARGLDIDARSTIHPETPEELGTGGLLHSAARSTVEEGVVVAEAHSSASGLELLEGIIRIEGLETSIEATSDGVVSTTAGHTTVSGLEIGGYGFVVDEEGLRPIAEGERTPGILDIPEVLRTILDLPDLLLGPDFVMETLGLDAEVVPHREIVDETGARRIAEGLRITVDLTVLHGALGEFVSLSDLAVLVLPDEVAVQVLPFLEVAPRLEFVIGRAEVRAAATEAFRFEPPDDLPPPPPTDDEILPPSAPDEFDAAPFEPGTTTPPTAEQPLPDPVTAEPPPGTVVAGQELPQFFDGIPVTVVALGMVVGALLAYGLYGLSGLLAGAAATTAGCAQRGVPDLRKG